MQEMKSSEEEMLECKPVVESAPELTRESLRAI